MFLIGQGHYDPGDRWNFVDLSLHAKDRVQEEIDQPVFISFFCLS